MGSRPHLVGRIGSGVRVSVSFRQKYPPGSVLRCPIRQKIAVFTYSSPHFCFPWRRPWGNHAKCSMDGKRIRCLQIVSQHVPIYLQQFPSYSNRKCKKSPFSRTAAHLETPLRLSCNMLHGWKDNSMLAKPLATCTYLSSIVSKLYDA